MGGCLPGSRMGAVLRQGVQWRLLCREAWHGVGVGKGLQG